MMKDQMVHIHRGLSVKIQRKKLFGKTEAKRAVMSRISHQEGRLLTKEPMLVGYQIAILMLDPDSQVERTINAKVTKVGTVDFHGKRVFEADVEFVNLSKKDIIMLENLFYI